MYLWLVANSFYNRSLDDRVAHNTFYSKGIESDAIFYEVTLFCTALWNSFKFPLTFLLLLPEQISFIIFSKFLKFEKIIFSKIGSALLYIFEQKHHQIKRSITSLWGYTEHRTFLINSSSQQKTIIFANFVHKMIGLRLHLVFIHTHKLIHKWFQLCSYIYNFVFFFFTY